MSTTIAGLDKALQRLEKALPSESLKKLAPSNICLLRDTWKENLDALTHIRASNKHRIAAYKGYLLTLEQQLTTRSIISRSQTLNRAYREEHTNLTKKKTTLETVDKECSLCMGRITKFLATLPSEPIPHRPGYCERVTNAFTRNLPFIAGLGLATLSAVWRFW